MNQQATYAMPSCVGQVSFLELNAPIRYLRPGSERRPTYSFDNAEVIAPYGPTTDALRFVLSQAVNGASFLHLALFYRERQLAHWILPAASLPQYGLLPLTYLVEAAGPLPAFTLDEGPCLLRNCSTSLGIHLEQDLRGGSVQLTFVGHTLRGAFCLERLHAGCPTWELGAVRQLLPRALQARA